MQPVSQAPVLAVLAGRPGTGKTTLARLLARELRAGYVRTDAIAGVLIRRGLTRDPPTAGRVAYAVAHEVAAGTLRSGTPVVVDAVNALPELRTGWIELARTVGARLVVLETTVPDEDLHRRRVEERRPDLAGQVVPTWAQVQAQWYDVWDEGRDGPRHVVDMTDAGQGVKVALAHIVAVASS